MSTRHKQEQEPAVDEVTEVAPGVLRMQLPISMPGLGHVNCYVLEDARGFALVDPGLPGKGPYRELTSRLASAGIPRDRVHTVIVTHSHPDHFGGAARLRADTGADIVTHARFRLLWDPSEPPDVDVEDAAPVERRMPWEPPPWGGPPRFGSRRFRLRLRASRVFPQLFRAPRPTVRLEDAQTISLARREWVAVHTPGHTEDHLCLFDPTEGVMLSGDHVLPTITPHIGGHTNQGDPLGTFFSSLDKVAAYGDRTRHVLPAHGHPFGDLAARADEIKQHHHERLDLLRRSIAEHGRPATVTEMSAHLFSARAQGGMADSETYAHLEHLCQAGEAERLEQADHYEYVLRD